jgi:hypothetical protein
MARHLPTNGSTPPNLTGGLPGDPIGNTMMFGLAGGAAAGLTYGLLEGAGIEAAHLAFTGVLIGGGVAGALVSAAIGVALDVIASPADIVRPFGIGSSHPYEVVLEAEPSSRL